MTPLASWARAPSTKCVERVLTMQQQQQHQPHWESELRNRAVHTAVLLVLASSNCKGRKDLGTWSWESFRAHLLRMSPRRRCTTALYPHPQHQRGTGQRWRQWEVFWLTHRRGRGPVCCVLHELLPSARVHAVACAAATAATQRPPPPPPPPPPVPSTLGSNVLPTRLVPVLSRGHAAPCGHRVVERSPQAKRVRSSTPMCERFGCVWWRW